MDEDYKYIRGKLDNIVEHIGDIKAEIKLLKYKASVWGILGGGFVVVGALITRKLVS